jgi:multiple sugar transport system permease protein
LWLFALPGILFFGLCFIYPLAYGAYLSTSDFTPKSFITGVAPFVGLDNFAAAIGSSLFSKALVNTVVITIVAVGAELVIGLALALLFNHRFPGSRWLPALILLPWLLPSVVVGTIWKWLLSGDGAINQLLGSVGIPTDAWLANPSTALGALIVVAIWGGLPYWAIILGAALKQVPQDQLEAAQLDGAGAWSRLVHIIIPNILPVISVLTVMSVVYNLMIIDLVLVLTAGGPAYGTVTLSYLSYRSSFQLFEFGEAAAYGVLLLVLTLGFAIIHTWVSGRRERRDA